MKQLKRFTLKSGIVVTGYLRDNSQSTVVGSFSINCSHPYETKSYTTNRSVKTGEKTKKGVEKVRYVSHECRFTTANENMTIATIFPSTILREENI